MATLQYNQAFRPTFLGIPEKRILFEWELGIDVRLYATFDELRCGSKPTMHDISCQVVYSKYAI